MRIASVMRVKLHDYIIWGTNPFIDDVTLKDDI